MNPTRGYGPVAKFFHWTTVALLVGQFLLGWFMPDTRRGMSPGAAMSAHLTIGTSILAIALIRYLWRLANPVPPAPDLPAWQRASSEMVHLLLYALLLVTTTSGWIFASTRGWAVSLFGAVPLPSLVAQGSEIGRAVGGLHGALSTVLLIAIAAHVLAALAHAFGHRDGVMHRMLPSLGAKRVRL